MSEKFKLNLIKKEVKKSSQYGTYSRETRWFVETNDGFDDTANGYGYKTPKAVYKAYSYFLNKDKYAQKKKEIKQWLKDNPDVKAEFDNYFHEDNCFYRAKDGEETSVENLILCIPNKTVVVEKLNSNKNLWQQLMRYYRS